MRWKRVGGGYVCETAHGQVWVAKGHDGTWFVKDDDTRLLLHEDGRGAIFLSLEDAQAAALMHAGDKLGGTVDDGLRWEHDEDWNFQQAS